MSAKTETIMKPHLVALRGALLALATVLVVLAVPLQAQPGAGPASIQFVVNGFQANSSAPFLLQGDQVGEGAVWQHLAGPFLGGTLALIPGAAPAFGGVGCRAEYSQDQIVTEDGSTITVNVHGVHCEPYDSPGAHTTTGSYSLVGGTGRFKDATLGGGTVTIDAHADGSATIHIGGFLARQCSAGMCGV
jgi:hypothetical protein